MAISQYGNEYYGLSGDDKPLGTPLNGRKFTEMDTSKEYRFDAENQQWLQQSGGGGGSNTLSGLTDVDISNPANGQTLVYNAESGKWENGGGGSGGDVLVVNVLATYISDGSTVTFDKTFAELKSAYEGGAVMLCKVVTEDNVNSVYGNSIAFLEYRPAIQVPIPAPESFFFEASFLDIQSNVHGCFVYAEINAEGSNVAIHPAEWANIT